MNNARANILGRRSIGHFLSPAPWRRRLVFWGGALAVGVVAAAFALSANWMTASFLRLGERYAWWPYVLAPGGLALGSYLTARFVPLAQGSGIPQTIAALNLRDRGERDRLLSLPVAGAKIALTNLALLCGASVGREGPTVQIGAAIMHALGRLARFSTVELDRGLILAGGAAGVAAAFNTPLAGIVFAIEELSRSFEEHSSGTLLTAVILAGVTATALLGNYTYFGETTLGLDATREWLAVLVCGVSGGLAGGAFSRLMLGLASSLPSPLIRIRRLRPALFAALCGTLLAALGWFSLGSTFGTGYAQARSIIQDGALPVPGFALMKAMATLATYLSGIPGGIFAPSLATGAALGAELHGWLPWAPVSIMALLSMAAYFAGVVQAPLTALVIVTEMTGDRALMLPLMAAVLLGRAAGAVLCRRSLYRGLAAVYMQRGGPAAPGAAESGAAS